MLPEEAIKEFQQIYEADTGEKLSMQTATEKANQLFAFFRIAIRPIPSQGERNEDENKSQVKPAPQAVA